MMNRIRISGCGFFWRISKGRSELMESFCRLEMAKAALFVLLAWHSSDILIIFLPIGRLLENGIRLSRPGYSLYAPL